MTATTTEHTSVNHKEELDRFQSLSISNSVLSRVPYELAVEYGVLPYNIDENDNIKALVASPADCSSIQNIQMYTGNLVIPKFVPKEKLLKLIAHHYGPQKEKTEHKTEQKSSRLLCSMHDSAVSIVNDVIHEAIRLSASDIHFEPFEREMCVRFRIDGVLQEMLSIPAGRIAEVISRLKIMCRMDIAEKRRPQDGRIRIEETGRDVDIRVSTLPTDFGEKAVLRLLDKSQLSVSLNSIGMGPQRLQLFKKAIQMPNGIVLITGPTGSGKTTTLYGAINHIKRPDINISTVEDPIEYNITGVNQTQVNTLIGNTFASSLRTLLRQDPDVIMVGEMRDQETAEIAIRSSLTGHLVLSTLHTNDAPSAVTRLLDMGIEPYLVSSSVSMIVAQRLVRKICPSCKCETEVSEDIRNGLGLSGSVKFYKGLGCSSCGHTGYKGRTGIFEVLPVSDTIRSLINKKAYAAEIRSAALKEGMVLLRESASSMLVDGITTAEEVLREVSVIS